ncbi:MAG: MarR family transcriptional regulator [Myxococcota bacterium]
MYEPHETAARAWALLFELLQAERPRLMQICDQTGMTAAELGLLKAIHPDSDCQMQGLSYFHDKSTVTRVIGRLVKRGLVERWENPADRREKLVRLTPSGEALRSEIVAWMTAPPASIRELSEEDRAHLVDALEHAVAVARRD